MELKTGEHQKAPLHCINDRKASFKTLFYVGSSFNLHLPSDSLRILAKQNTALFSSAHSSVHRHTPYFFSRFPSLFFSSAHQIFFSFSMFVSLSPPLTKYSPFPNCFPLFLRCSSSPLLTNYFPAFPSLFLFFLCLPNIYICQIFTYFVEHLFCPRNIFLCQESQNSKFWEDNSKST